MIPEIHSIFFSIRQRNCQQNFEHEYRPRSAISHQANMLLNVGNRNFVGIGSLLYKNRKKKKNNNATSTMKAFELPAFSNSFVHSESIAALSFRRESMSAVVHIFINGTADMILTNRWGECIMKKEQVVIVQFVKCVQCVCVCLCMTVYVVSKWLCDCVLCM